MEMSSSNQVAAARGNTPQARDEVTYVRLSPYKETPEWYRTTIRVEGAKRWFEKAKVSVVWRDPDAIVLSMPKAYADARQGISSLVIEEQTVPTDDTVTSAAGPEALESERDQDAGLPEPSLLQMGPAGRVVIPVAFRDAMHVKEGDRLMVTIADGELRLITPRMSVKRAQKIVRETIPGDDSLADSLIEERRREFESEMTDG
jgi:AbrB family looped-hinge helix DNA binding protein